MKKGSLFAVVALVLVACTKSPKTAVEQETRVYDLPQPAETAGVVAALPHTIVYRMSGDYANFVPVTLDSTGTYLVSYPDPLDIRASSKPEPLGNGWYLDHRGVNANTAFTSYTYEAYQQLKECPSQAELLQSIIARKAIVEIRDLGTKDLSKEEIQNVLIIN